MKKNIFSVFQNNDTDDEGNKNKKVEGAKPTKKELRAEDQIKREAYGDRVQKEVPNSQRYHDGPRNKGDYKPGEKRPYERHSGTGRPAFTHDFTKGGHGKGNVGGQKDIEADLKGGDPKVEGDQGRAGESQPEIKAEPVEEIITLDEFVGKNSYLADLLGKKEEEKKPAAPIKISDTSVKLVAPKEKESTTYIQKNVKRTGEFVHTKGTNVNLEGAAPANQGNQGNFRGRNNNSGRDNRDNKDSGNRGGKPARVEFNEANFPALS